MAKLLLITGGGRGIGAATARLAAQRGYRVLINYHRDQESAETLAGAICDAGGEAWIVPADVAVESDVVELFESIDERWGAIDGLVNNAGILEQQCTLEKIDGARLQRVFATNVFGTIYCAREAVNRMSLAQNGQGGNIVNLSSIAAVLGAASEYIDYAASKGAIDSFTRGLAREVADQGIRVNAVRPGLVDTSIHASGGEPGRIERVSSAIPMRRAGSAEEVAEAILWLLSDASSYCTGSVLDVGGGR